MFAARGHTKTNRRNKLAAFDTLPGVEAVGLRTYRVTLDSAIGASETVSLAAIAELAGNAAIGPLTIDPAG